MNRATAEQPAAARRHAEAPPRLSGAESPLLVMDSISKRFPGVVALDRVSLTLGRGEVLALMGENGAGKSTLMKVLGGLLQPDSGSITIDGSEVRLAGVDDARRRGIALIHQELVFAPNLDIAGNLFLGNEGRGTLGLRPLPRAELRARAARLLARVGLDLPVTTLAGTMVKGQLQLCEIAKALALDARIIVMDEPTSSLTQADSVQLFAIIDKLRSEGMGIVYISHRMDEVMQLADRISVLRDGRHVGDLTRAEATHERVVQLMVGRQVLNHYFPERPVAAATPDVLLRVKDLLVPGTREPVSFEARRGEILGFAGLVGAGRTELMQVLFGVSHAVSGSIELEGKPFAPRHPDQAIARGVFLAPEDRKQQGLVLAMSVERNTTLPDLPRHSRWGVIDRRAERGTAEAEVRRLGIKVRNIQQKVVNLSGGNQQKVVLGKWLAMRPRLLILDEPTRGIDVGAKAEIYRHMAALAASGVTLIMVSSDMEEILGMSDRVVVMHERRIRGVLARAELSAERVAALMTGGSGERAAEGPGA
jgi:ribose transport system ATP-binding protein